MVNLNEPQRILVNISKRAPRGRQKGSLPVWAEHAECQSGAGVSRCRPGRVLLWKVPRRAPRFLNQFTAGLDERSESDRVCPPSSQVFDERSESDRYEHQTVSASGQCKHQTVCAWLVLTVVNLNEPQ